MSEHISNLLIVDDNAKVAESICKILDLSRFSCRYASDTREALSAVIAEDLDVVLLDIMLGKDDGLECLRLIKGKVPDIPVIMITGFGTIDNAVRSMKLGAYDFIQKPLNVEHLRKILDNAVQMRQLMGENRHLRAGIGESPSFISTESPRMRDLIAQAARVARTGLPILIRGENGTGKELLADYIHSQSDRSGKPMLKINCAAFPESLLDNELFGHERGAYTGAVSSFSGIFERADGGTLFMDEIGDMPLTIQAKILRVLQNFELRRIGSSETIKIDVRFIAATNKNLENLISGGSFREDLFFRLNAVTLSLPSLQNRQEDIPLLTARFIREYSDSTNCAAKAVSGDAKLLLTKYSWPGNVRELKNTIMYACAMASGPVIQLQDLPPAFQSEEMSKSDIRFGPSGPREIPRMRVDTSSKYGLDPMSEAEAEIIAATLAQCRFNKKRAAEQLHISRNTLYKKIALYGLLDDHSDE